MVDAAGERSRAGERVAFHRSLPAKRMGAGAVIRNESGGILIVKPVYKPGWELPGGAVEDGESPRAACEREIAEELQLSVRAGELLCVDYNSSTGDYLESLMFLFHVEPLDERTVASIRLDPAELSEFRFVSIEEAIVLLHQRVARRLDAVVRPTSLGTYMEDQRRPGEGS
jgi:8-oxo-dGTP diphosphatase